MNDIPSEPGLTPYPEITPKSGSLWGSTVTFLKRDIKSFFPRADKCEGPAEQVVVAPEDSGAPAPAQVDVPIEPLVDVSKLPNMAFRREVLDWRDNFHANLMITLGRLHDAFDQQVQAELADTSFFRKLVTRKSNEVLQDGFTRLVRLPLITAVRKEEAKLNVCAQKWGVFGKADLAFDIRTLSAECASLHDIGFKPSNRELILSRSKALILGPAGLAAVFRDQGLQLSRKLMDTKTSCSAP
ncbi:MAG: hypothetical protein WBK26_14940 [Burkholderiaceae bacterium]